MDDNLPSCFVIQQFDDGGTFDRRYRETIEPALCDAGVNPLRADEILGLQPVIDKIESAIRNASICVAEVSTDNPNVWLEVGIALALNRPTVILCDRSLRPRLPFDIQHRPVVLYRTDLRSGFDHLASEVTKLVRNELEKSARISKAPILKEGTNVLEDLKGYEVAILSTALALWPTHASGGTQWELQQRLSRLGFEDIALGLGITRLMDKGYLQKKEYTEDDGYKTHEHPTFVYQVTPLGIEWLRTHESELRIEKPPQRNAFDDDIPF